MKNSSHFPNSLDKLFSSCFNIHSVLIWCIKIISSFKLIWFYFFPDTIRNDCYNPEWSPQSGMIWYEKKIVCCFRFWSLFTFFCFIDVQLTVVIASTFIVYRFSSRRYTFLVATFHSGSDTNCSHKSNKQQWINRLSMEKSYRVSQATRIFLLLCIWNILLIFVSVCVFFYTILNLF